MASGIVLAKKWGQPERPLTTTSWQLIAGGIVLLPLALWFEGIPKQPLTMNNVIGYGYLALVGAVLAYTLWFRGINALPVGSITFLSLLSPVVAVLSGWVVLAQALSIGQIIGTAIIFAAILLALGRPAEQTPGVESSPQSVRPVQAGVREPVH